jgi:hypothetical protein
MRRTAAEVPAKPDLASLIPVQLLVCESTSEAKFGCMGTCLSLSPMQVPASLDLASAWTQLYNPNADSTPYFDTYAH